MRNDCLFHLEKMNLKIGFAYLPLNKYNEIHFLICNRFYTHPIQIM
jgi:hypothetical protein